MAAKYTIQLTPAQLDAIVNDNERIGVDVPTVVGTDSDGNQLDSIGIHIIGPSSTESTEEESVEDNNTSLEDEDIPVDAGGNIAPEEEAAMDASFEPMTESKVDTFDMFLKRK